MSDAPSDNVEAQEAIQEAVEMTRQERHPEALSLFETYLTPLSGGTIGDRRVAAAAFSYYGYCVAKVRRKYADGVKYCNISLRANPLDPEHRTNLAMVYLERDDRAKAVESLNSGLRLDRRNKRLNILLESIGRRQPPVIPFLPRHNPVNVWLGKKRASKG
jgi:tetratricopeptide (TPR) repeat protein